MRHPAATCKTLRIALSEAAVKRAAADGVTRQIKDPRFPELLLRFRTNRSRASWHVIRHQGGLSHWEKVGNWPALSVAAMLEALPDVLRRLACDPQAAAKASGWSTCGDLLAWFAGRMESAAYVSESRRRTAASILRCHLVPGLGALPLSEVGRPALEAFAWNLQKQVKPGYLVKVWQLLGQAFGKAYGAGLIEGNPLRDVKLADFVAAKAGVKEGRLRPVQVLELLTAFAGSWEQHRAGVALAVLMLMHGTRLGEARRAKWVDFDLVGGTWTIPAAHAKSGQGLVLPLTAEAVAVVSHYRQQQTAGGYAGAWLFPGPNRKPLGERQASAAFQRLGLALWTSHDLRKLARTCWADLGVDFLVGEALLNHKLRGVSAAYIHTTLEAKKREALELWHRWLAVRGLDFFCAPESVPRHAKPTTPAKPAPVLA